MQNGAPTRIPVRIYDPLFAAAEVSAIFSGPGLVRQMLRFEWGLALALEQNGLIPAGVSAEIETVTIDGLDLERIAQQAASAGNLAIPFVSQLTMSIKEKNPSLAAYVHWGATSQDVLDTATVLQAREALSLLEHDLNAIAANLVPLIKTHTLTLLPGRTWLQQGPPVTLGLKLASWLDALQRHRARFREASARCIALQFGGAVGTLAALGKSGPAVSQALGCALGLTEPAVPWHTHRDRVAEIAATLGLLTGTLGKIARDFSLLMQTEVAEAFEPVGEGRGGSSTMPHKRNPVYSSIMLAAAARMPGLISTMLTAMVQEHERGLGNWQAEWETLAEIFRLTGGSLRVACQLVSGFTVDSVAMREHININGGIALSEAVSFALARKIGKAQAHHLLEVVSRAAINQHLSLRETLLQSDEIRQHLSIEQIDCALDPAQYLGSASVFIATVLANEEKA
jgi:3-carboxy-cis,cis-muconate cycloisomerase